MTDEEFQRRQAEASALIAATENPVDREILSFAYSATLRRVIRNRRSDAELVFEPMEVLETLKYMLRHKEILSGLISGKYSTFEEACDDLGIF